MEESQAKLWHLERFNVIQVLSMEERKILGSLATMKSYKKGDKIFLPPDACKYVYFLKEGNIRISHITSAGDDQVTDILGPGELFGRYTWNKNSENCEAAIALSDSLICSFDVNDWNSFIFNNPKFTISVLKETGSKVRRLQTRIEQLQFHSIAERVRAVIKELANKHATVLDNPDRMELKLNLTHQDIAMLAGTSRQSVTTELRELQRKNIISYTRSHIIIEDINRL